MVKAVFIASSHSSYDDRPGEVYHFPNSYLSRVAQTVGDWVLLYQGRRGGAVGYYAVQRVERIEPDPGDPTHAYAVLDRGSLWGFERHVPRLDATGAPFESGLARMGGNNTSAVRLISDPDFARILAEGLREDLSPASLSRSGREPLAQDRLELAEAQSPFTMPGAPDRPLILTSRALRDRAFARQVKRAYGGTCAMSGLRLTNGGGRMEVEAAHIIPVEERGPDVVSNGLALSGTLHWMFDRGLVSVDEDHSLLIAPGTVATDIAARLFVPDRRLILPANAQDRPHPAFFDWHRRHRYKG